MSNRLSPYLIIGLLGLLFFGDLVLHPTAVLYSDHSDLLAMHLPMKRFLVRSWQQTGEVPLWNPYSFGGMPFIHDVQVAAFYPLHWPLYLLPEDCVGSAMSWLVVLHVLIAGWCMHVYACSQGLGRTAALVAAIGYMFAGKWLLHILAGGHYILIPLAWLPLVLYWLEQAISRRSLLHATWAGAAFALIILGTHPQMTLYAGLFIVVWSLGSMQLKVESSRFKVKLRSATWSCEPILIWLGLGAWTALVATALSAVQLLPALEAAPEASRATGVAPGDIVAVALPSFLGLVGPGWNESWEDRGGLGVVWVAAAVMAPLLCRGRVRFQVGICLVLLFFSLGGAALLHWLPGFRLFQLPVRMLILLAFGVALLAAWTTQALVGGLELAPDLRRQCRRLLFLVLSASIVLALAAGFASYRAWLSNAASQGDTVPAWIGQLDIRAQVYWAVLLLIVPVAGWLLNPRCSLTRNTWKLAWVAILLADCWALAWPHVAVRSDAELYDSSACVHYLVNTKEQCPSDHWRVLDRGLAGLPSSTPLGAGLPMLGDVQIEPILGYNSFDVRRYKEYLQFIADSDKPLRPREGVFGYPILSSFPIRNKALLDLLGTRYLLQPRDDDSGSFSHEPQASAADRERNQRWRMQFEDQHPHCYSFLAGGIQELPAYTLYENLDAFPRAFVLGRAEPLADRPYVLEQIKSVDFHRMLLLEGTVSRPESRPATPGEEARPAFIREYSPNRVVVEVSGEKPGYLVLTDVWFPGWSCTVDGKMEDLYRADFLFRAVAVPSGNHEVVFVFAPSSYRWGKYLSLATLGAIALFSCSRGLRPRPQAKLSE